MQSPHQGLARCKSQHRLTFISRLYRGFESAKNRTQRKSGRQIYFDCKHGKGKNFQPGQNQRREWLAKSAGFPAWRQASALAKDSCAYLIPASANCCVSLRYSNSDEMQGQQVHARQDYAGIAIASVSLSSCTHRHALIPACKGKMKLGVTDSSDSNGICRARRVAL